MKKINKGIFLLVLVIMTFCIFIYQKNISEEKEKIEITKFIKKFLEVRTENSFIKKEDRDINKILNKEDYKSYLENIKNNLSKYYDKSRLDYLYDCFVSRIDLQLDSYFILNDYNEELVSIDNIYYHNGYVIVSYTKKSYVDEVVRINAVKSEKTGRYVGHIKNEQGTSNKPYNVMVLKKENENYKILVDSSYTLPKYFY